MPAGHVIGVNEGETLSPRWQFRGKGAGAFDPEKMAALSDQGICLKDEGIDEKIPRNRDEVIRLKAEGKL